MALGARKQAALYYARKRRRSLVNAPRLFRTGAFEQNSVVSGSVANVDLDRPITFQCTVDLSTPGLAFSWGTSVVATVNANDLTVSFPDGDAVIPHPATGVWNLIVSIRPGDGSAQIWNQRASLWRTNDLTPGTWANPDENLTVGTIPSLLGLFTAQLPRHFFVGGEIQQFPAGGVTQDFWLNSTALNFMVGFPQPLFEGDV